MVAIDVAVALLHPIAVIVLSTLWTLKILRTEYREYLSEEPDPSESETQTAETATEV